MKRKGKETSKMGEGSGVPLKDKFLATLLLVCKDDVIKCTLM